MGRNRASGRGTKVRGRGSYKPPFSNTSHNKKSSLTITRRFDSDQSFSHSKNSFISPDPVDNKLIPKSVQVFPPISPVADESWQDDFGLETEVHLGLPGDNSGEEDAFLDITDKSFHRRSMPNGCGDVTDDPIKQPSLKNRLGPTTLQNRLGPVKNLQSRLGSVKNNDSVEHIAAHECEYENIDAFVLSPDENMDEFNFEEEATNSVKDKIDLPIPTVIDNSRINKTDAKTHVVQNLSKNDLRISLSGGNFNKKRQKKQFKHNAFIKIDDSQKRARAIPALMNTNSTDRNTIIPPVISPRIGPLLHQQSYVLQSRKSLLPSPPKANIDVNRRNFGFHSNDNSKEFKSSSFVGPRLSLLGNYSESATSSANVSVSGQTIKVALPKRRHLLESTHSISEKRPLLQTSNSLQTFANVREKGNFIPNSLEKRTLLTNVVEKRTLLPNTGAKRTLLPNSNIKRELISDTVPKQSMHTDQKQTSEKRTLIPNATEQPNFSHSHILTSNPDEKFTYTPIVGEKRTLLQNMGEKRTLLQGNSDKRNFTHNTGEKRILLQNTAKKYKSPYTSKKTELTPSVKPKENLSSVPTSSKIHTKLIDNVPTSTDKSFSVNANESFRREEKQTLFHKFNSDLTEGTLSGGNQSLYLKTKSNVQEPSRAVADILQQLVRPNYLVDELNLEKNKEAYEAKISRHDNKHSSSEVEENRKKQPELFVIEPKRSQANNQWFSGVEKNVRSATETTMPVPNRALLPTPTPVRLPDPHSLQQNIFSAKGHAHKNFSSSVSIDHTQINATNKSIQSFSSCQQRSTMLPNPNHLSVMHRKERENEQSIANLQQPEATIKEEIVNCFKERKYADGLAKLQDASNNYPDEFGDPVMCEVIEFCYKQGAVSTAVLAAQFVREPDQKLLAFFSKVAELHKSELRQYSDQLWIIFYRSLTHNPSPKAMMSFIKCFSTLRCWNKVWTAVETFARKDVIPIDGLCLCLHSLANGNGLEYLLTGVNILKSMSAQNAEKVGLDCIDRLWLQCALKGLHECVDHLDNVRSFLHPSVNAEERFAGQTRAKIMEMVMGVRLEDLCVFIYALRSHVNKEAVRDFMAEAFSVAEGYIEKLENFLHVMTEKSHSERVKSVDQCLASVCLLLVQRATERQRWDEVVGLVHVIQNCGVSLEETHASQVAESHLLAMLRTGKLSAAAALLEDTESGGLRLSDSTPERLIVRTPLLKQLYDMATSARDTTRVHLREACTALAGLLRVKEKDVGQVVGLSEIELNRQYNELLKVCCLRGTLEGLRFGLNIIPAAHRSSLVINATVLRVLLLACFQHKQQSDQLHFLDLGMQVGIYPSIKIVSGPKKIAFPTDLSSEEILVIISTLFRRMKTHLVELLSSANSNPPDVLEECDVLISALSVGERDRNFITSQQLASTEAGLLTRIREVLSKAGNFYCQVQVEQITISGGISALRLNANAVYQCVYYMEAV